MGLEAVKTLIDRSTRTDVPLGVLFAALDRLTELTGPPGDAGGGAVANICCGSLVRFGSAC